VPADASSSAGFGLTAISAWLLDPFYNLVERTLSTTRIGQEDNIITAALAGEPTVAYFISPMDGEIIVAAHPIIDEGAILGVVVLKQTTDRILNLRRDALKRIVNFSVISVIIFAGIILLFSARLARRIRRLGNEATGVIDRHGRLTSPRLTSETNSGDELGDLARGISNMLTRLHQHNQFLENMPRTLRHEINNPLNTLSTSLDNLATEQTPEGRQKYLDSARRGLNRIGLIVQNLADAANLEEALIGDDLECIDLKLLLQSYVSNCKMTQPGRAFTLNAPDEPLFAWICDYRIEQLLDKLIDNAVDFSEVGSTICVDLKAVGTDLNLDITNVGPGIPENLLTSIFDSMVTARANNPDNRLHFGIGLYVVRVIADHHQGSVHINNLADPSGVRVGVTLPRAAPPANQTLAL